MSKDVEEPNKEIKEYIFQRIVGLRDEIARSKVKLEKDKLQIKKDEARIISLGGGILELKELYEVISGESPPEIILQEIDPPEKEKTDEKKNLK